MTHRTVSDDAAVELLRHLVAIPSPSGGERAASETLVHWMGEHGFAARVDDVGNAVGTRGTGALELLLLGHIDTFPGEIPVRQEGDLLHGRGAVDAKGPLCAFAVAAARAAVPAGWRVTVVGAVEEEAATSRGAHQVLDERVPAVGGPGPPAACVIGEPSRWDRIVLGYKGRLVVDAVLRAPFSHSAGSQPLPAERAVALWSAVTRHCEGANRGSGPNQAQFDALTPSLRAMVTTDLGTYGEARLSMGVRLPPGVDPSAAEADLVSAMAQSLFGPADGVDASAENGSREGVPCRHHGFRSRLESGLQLTCTVFGHEWAFKAGKSNALVRAFLAGVRGQGGEPRFVVKTGTSDMNLVGRHWPDTPILAYGPGDSALDHTPGEHVSVREYLRSVSVLEAVLGRVMTQAVRSTSPPASQR
ncbi:MAG TPA: M20/M25/M40 family metallo-hydrolase [Gemmatimonadales bacterium]